jgi:Sulfotransferase family
MDLVNLVFNGIPKDHDLVSRTDSSGKAALAFVHIPKTAGTWFTSFLMQHFTQHEIAPPLYSAPDSTDFSAPSYRLFAGHFRFMAINTKRPMRLVTFLRDPFQRTASHYRFWHHKEHFGEAWRTAASEQVAEAVEWVQRSSYEEFVHADNPVVQSCIRDVQTNFLTSEPDPSHPQYLRSSLRNLEEKFFFVGLQEFSAESIQLFNYQTGSTSEPEFSVSNVSPEPYDVTLSPAGRERLLELLQNDLVIYQAGLRLFKRRLAEISGD